MKDKFIDTPDEMEAYFINRMRISINTSSISSVETSFILGHMVGMDRALEISDKLVAVLPKVMARLKGLALFEPSFPEEDKMIDTLSEDMINAYFARFINHELLMAGTGHGRYQGILKPVEFKRDTDANVRLNLGVYWSQTRRYLKATTYDCLFTKTREGARRISMKPLYFTDELLF